MVEKVADQNGVVYARKTFSPSPTIGEDYHEGLKTRFRREVRIQQQLGGKEVVPVLHADLSCNVPWFVMPFCEKVYEEQIAQDRGSGSVDINALADILNGLQFIHSLGFVHRDLNPKNILLHEGVWKLSDLGAILPPTGATVTITEDTLIFTELYCSPEQHNDFHSAQPSADIYSFGAILHDLFGVKPRTPYQQQTADGDIGIVIEKCTETNPAKRPNVKVLRGLLFEVLVDMGGLCKVENERAAEWLEKLEDIENWGDETFDGFVRFFAQVDPKERSPGHLGWVDAISTPFLTRIKPDALAAIVRRGDGFADTIVERYCDWAGSTAFDFFFSDSICSRLVTIFDHGSATNKARAMVALIRLAETHNRWYIMRSLLRRCGEDRLEGTDARRIRIEIITEELEWRFGRCVREVGWSLNLIHPELASLIET